MSMNKTCPISNFGSVVVSAPMSHVENIKTSRDVEAFCSPNSNRFADAVSEDLAVLTRGHHVRKKGRDSLPFSAC